MFPPAPLTVGNISDITERRKIVPSSALFKGMYNGTPTIHKDIKHRGREPRQQSKNMRGGNQYHRLINTLNSFIYCTHLDLAQALARCRRCSRDVIAGAAIWLA